MNELRNIVSRLAVMRIGVVVPRREEGQTLVEYALILFLIAIIVAVALTFLSGHVSTVFSSISDSPFL